MWRDNECKRLQHEVRGRKRSPCQCWCCPGRRQSHPEQRRGLAGNCTAHNTASQAHDSINHGWEKLVNTTLLWYLKDLASNITITVIVKGAKTGPGCWFGIQHKYYKSQPPVFVRYIVFAPTVDVPCHTVGCCWVTSHHRWYQRYDWAKITPVLTLS